MVQRLSQLPASCPALAGAHTAPHAALPGSMPVGREGGHRSMCLSGAGGALWLPHSPWMGAVPLSPSSSVHPIQETHTAASPNGKKRDLKAEEVGSALEVILKA